MATKSKLDNTTMVLSSVGALGGLYYAFAKKKGMWGYVGFFILGSIAGGLVGNVVSGVMKPKNQPLAKTPVGTTTTTTTTEEVVENA